MGSERGRNSMGRGEKKVFFSENDIAAPCSCCRIEGTSPGLSEKGGETGGLREQKEKSRAPGPAG